MKTLVIICALCALGWRPVHAQDADALLAQSKQAAGGDAWNVVRSLSVTSEGSKDGNQIVKEDHFDVRRGRYLTTYRLGSYDAPGRAENAEGYDGKTAWEMDPSGYSHAVADAASLRRVITKAYLARHAYWFPGRAVAQRHYAGRKQEGGRSLDVIQIVPEGGQPFDLWIDSTTHMIDRIVEQEAMEKWTTSFSDYSQAGDLKFPFATRSTAGKPEFDFVWKVRTVQTGTADEKVFFGVPPNPAPDYTMLAGKDSVTVPFQFVANHILIPIRINGKGPFTAALDTGCETSLMTPVVATELNVISHGAAQARGFGDEALTIGSAEVETAQIGGITMLRPTFAVVKVDIGLPIEAIIGYEVFRRLVVRVDYDTRLLTLTRPDKFVYRGNGEVLPLHLYDHDPIVDGSVDGIKGVFALDTGSGGALDLFAPFVKTHELRSKYLAGPTTQTGVGIGGAMQGQSVRVRSLIIGAAETRKVNTNLSAEQGGVASDVDIAGNIGEAVLRQFNLTFDYTHSQIILEKNKRYGQAEDGHAGFALEPQDKEWHVSEVVPGGAAAQAGIKEGDDVLQIEGKDAVQLPYLALWDVFDHPVGTRVRMLLQSGGQKRLVAVTLGKVP